jgi:rhomboid protease GluP
MSEVIGTYLSRKPDKSALAVIFSSLALMAILSAVSWNNPNLRDLWVANGQQVFERGQSYRLLLSLLLHSSPGHLLSNAYMFGVLGYFICSYFGRALYFFLFLGLGTFVHAVALYTYSNDVQLVGASGVVYLFAGYWLTMFIAIDRRFTFANRLMRATGVGLIILFPTTFEPDVSYRTHAFGFLTGAIFGITYFLGRKSYFRSFEILKEPELLPEFDPQLWN